MSAEEPSGPRVRVLTAARLRARGTSPAQIRTLARRGALVGIGRGIYVSGAVARQFASVPHGDHLLRAAAALVLSGPGCVVSHRSAALIHGIDLVGEVADVTISGRRGRRDGSRHAVHTYLAALPDSQVTSKYGLPVTTAVRTVIDLARTLPFAEGVVAADCALRQGLVTQAELEMAAGECPRRRGSAQIDRVVGFATGLAESPLESLARVAFGDQGLPPPILQMPIGGDRGFIGRVDFYWKRYRTIAEVDGALKYADPNRARAQLWRDKALREAGYEVVHFNWHEITAEPDQVAAAIRSAFRRGAQDPAA